MLPLCKTSSREYTSGQEYTEANTNVKIASDIK